MTVNISPLIPIPYQPLKIGVIMGLNKVVNSKYFLLGHEMIGVGLYYNLAPNIKGTLYLNGTLHLLAPRINGTIHFSAPTIIGTYTKKRHPFLIFVVCFPGDRYTDRQTHSISIPLTAETMS